MKKLIATGAFASLFWGILTSILYKTLGSGVYLSLAITFLTTFYHFAMRILVACIITVLRKNKAETDILSFRLNAFEKSFYKAIKLQNWKAYAPTFRKELFSLKKNPLQSIYHNMTNAEISHGLIVPLSFLPLIFSKPLNGFVPFFITSVLAACFDLQFVFIQRFNKERLSKLIAKKSA